LYVPNNDIDSAKGDLTRSSEYKSEKLVTPQAFDAQIPLRYLWFDAPGLIPPGLKDIVNALHTLGRGVDAAYAEFIESHSAQVPQPQPGIILWRPGASASRSVNLAVPVKGSFESMEQRYAGFLARLTRVDGIDRFAQPPMTTSGRILYGKVPNRLVFSIRRSDAPDKYYKFAAIQTGAIVSGLQQIVRDSYSNDADLVERLIIGRHATARDLERRVRFIPLPSRGHRHADGKIRRILVEFPPGCPIRPDAVAWALEGDALPSESALTKQEFTTVDVGSTNQTAGKVVPVLSIETTSVDTTLQRLAYSRPSACWQTVTPAVVSLPSLVDRQSATAEENVRAQQEVQFHRAVRVAVRQAGYPKPSSITVQTEPFGGYALPARSYADGTRFHPSRFIHVALRFPEPVAGPVIIGDGRFLGLGLLESVDVVKADKYAFLLQPATPLANRHTVLRQFRRALMSRCASLSKDRLPTLLTGHGTDGKSARSGQHEHLYFAPRIGNDENLIGIEVYLPNIIDYSAEKNAIDTSAVEEMRRGAKLLERALTGFDELRFGQTVHVLAAVDPTPLGRASSWTSVTPYVSTRRPRAPDALKNFVTQDVEKQLVSLSRPKPLTVSASNTRLRADGLVTADLRIEFQRDVTGPFLLGRDSHFGGGLMHPEASQK